MLIECQGCRCKVEKLEYMAFEILRCTDCAEILEGQLKGEL